MTFHDFKFYIGETIMFCQIIESNIKVIYVNFLNKNKEENWKIIEKETLGSMVKKLQELDRDNKLLSNDEYYYLHQVTGKRNHWCHQSFINFLYTGGDFTQSQQYLQECKKLEDDHQQLQRIYRALENIRIKIIRENKNTR